MSLRFRPRGTAIQVLRVTSKPNTDRIVEVPLGSIPIAGTKLPEALLLSLTEEERVEIDSYIDARVSVQALSQRLAALTLSQTIAEAGNYLLSVSDPAEKAGLTENFKEALGSLRSILQRAAKAEQGG